MTIPPPESEFGPALARLMQQAGKPTLRTIADGVAKSTGVEITPQRISDWRRGRHLSRDFETVMALIMWLNRRALDAGVTDLLPVPEWRKLWEAYHDPTTNRLGEPFPGLASMSADDRLRYFGRDDTIFALTNLLWKAKDADDGSIVIVTGVSGAGKSSLLGAGLAKATSPWNDPVRLTVGDGALADAKVPDGTTLIVVDQFEEIFALSETDRATIVKRLGEFSDRGIVVVLGIRADFFGPSVEYPILARAWQERSLILSELSDAQLRQVITEPVALAGGKIDPGLAELIIDDLHQATVEGDRAGQLPLLAHALQVMWGQRAGNRLTIAAYRAGGGITSAVADTAETTWAALDPADRPEARAILLALMQFGPRRTPMRRAVTPAVLRERFSPAANTIVEAFADARLLTVTAETITFIHEAVLTAWPRMADWIAEDADLLQWMQQVDVDATVWAADGQRADYLYRGARLETARERRRELGDHRASLMPTAAGRFLDAADKQEHRRRRIRLGAIALVLVLALVSSITAVIATRQASDLARQRNSAEHAALMSSIDGLVAADPSLAARLLAVADRRYPSDPRVISGVLAAYMSPLARTVAGHTGAVYDVAFSRDGRLMATASNDRSVRIWSRADGAARPFQPVATLADFTTFVTSVTFDPQAQLLAAASGDGTVRVWSLDDPAAPRKIATLHPGRGTAYLTRFSPSGRHLATTSDDGTVTVYRTRGQEPPLQTAVLRGHDGPVRTLAFNGSGTVLASGGEDQTVRLWTAADTDTPRAAGRPITGFPSITHAVTFLPDDTTLAVTGDNANAQLWNTADPASPTPMDTALAGVTGGSWSLSANPRLPLLARAGDDGVVHVWNTTSTRGPLPVWDLQRSAAPGAVRMMTTSFSPDGRELAVGRSDGGVDIWTLPTGLLPDRGAPVSGVDMDRSTNRLVTVGADAQLNVWTRDDDGWQRRSRVAIDSRANNRPRVVLSSDGKLAATANNNGGLVELWDIADPDRPRRAGELRVGTRYTFALAFAPDSRELAVGATDTSIQRWDVTDPAAPTPIGEPLSGPHDLIRTVSYSADRSRLVVGSDDGNAYVYRLGENQRDAVVLPMSGPVPAAVFASDARYVVVGGDDLVVWRIDDGAPTVADRVDGIHAETVARADDRFMVGTETRAITEYRIGADGSLTEGVDVSPVLGGSRTVLRWVLPSDTGDGPDYPVAGDGTGVLYLQTTDLARARAWICRTTGTVTTAEHARYLGRLSGDDGC